MSSRGKTKEVVKKQLINNVADLDFKRLRKRVCELQSKTTCLQYRTADVEVFLTLNIVLSTATGGRQPRSGK